MIITNKQTNKLADEKSPYLLQHANNPVDWYPWGEETFAKGIRENKRISLTIGYSTSLVTRWLLEPMITSNFLEVYITKCQSRERVLPQLASKFKNIIKIDFHSFEPHKEYA